MLIYRKIDHKNESISSQLTKVVFKVNDIVKTHQSCISISPQSKNLINSKSSANSTSPPSLPLDTIKSNDGTIASEIEPTSQEIAKRIEDVLKQFKIIRNECDLPENLTKKIAQDIIGMSETEPCGLQGCLLYISLEEDDEKCQMIGSLKLGERTIVPTFEMHLYLRRRYSDWFKLLASRLFKNFFRDPHTLHDVYKLSKRKLFRTLAVNHFYART